MSIQNLGTIFAIVVGLIAFFSSTFTTWSQIKYQRFKDELEYKNKIYNQNIKKMQDAFDNLYSNCYKTVSTRAIDIESAFYGSLAIALQYVPEGKKETFYKLRNNYIDFWQGNGNSQLLLDNIFECIKISQAEISKIQEEQKQLMSKSRTLKIFPWLHKK